MPSGIHFKFVKAPMNLGHGLMSAKLERPKCLQQPPQYCLQNADWHEAYRELVRSVDAAGAFDLALISCGGLGMLLGAEMRMRGQSAIYVGGSLQAAAIALPDGE